MGLEDYRKKRNFSKTLEPKGEVSKYPSNLFSVQKHAASHLHYDFRLELEGVLKSWAVPKGPCLDTRIKRLAIQVEDHPIEYAMFEGTIPQGEYGGGTVMLWDYGVWKSLDSDPIKALRQGHLHFELRGKKLKGLWDLIHFKSKKWFLIKHTDRYARPVDEYDVTVKKSRSVLSKETIEEIAARNSPNAIWHSKRKHANVIKNLKQLLTPSAFPEKINVELATLVDTPPLGDSWLHEVKFDGYRIIAFKNKNQVNLFSRNHIEWTDKFPNIVAVLKNLPVTSFILDGEVVVLDENQRSDLQHLQNAMQDHAQAFFIYYVFDLLYLEHYDLRSLALIKRKTYLAQLLSQASSEIRYSDHVINHGDEVFKQSCEFALEGIVSKAINSIYQGKRTKDWLKIKCIQRQEFVIGGFSKPNRSRKFFGSLYLGFFNSQGELIYCGNVGTGFTEASLRHLFERLQPIISPNNPFTTRPPQSKKATWVLPKLVAEIEFIKWTQEQRLRHPSFKGLRMDKKPQEIKQEKTIVTKAVTTSLLTNPQKILYKEDRITKQDVYEYYEAISHYILPFIRYRPLTLLRCPNNYQSCFFQKHLSQTKQPGLFSIPIEEKNKKIKHYIYLEDEKGLLSLIQMGVLEIHPWGSLISELNQPDMLIFDLDPSPHLSWKNVVQAAFDIKSIFEQLNLSVFVKTTGGKGLHLVIPIKAEHVWETIKTYTQLFSVSLESNHPQRFISKMTKVKRKGKIFIDYLRNQKGATAIAAYSTRARLHAPVATPIHWDELTNRFEDTFFTLKTLPKRLQSLAVDPWKTFWSTQQSLGLKEQEKE